jgi:putative transposase
MTEYARSVVSSGRAGVNQICRLLGISKKTYYYSQDPDQTIEHRYKRLKAMIERIIKENPAYGYRRIKKALFDDFNEVVNHKVLLKVLRLWGLQLKRRIRPPRKSWVTNILDFLELRANLIWRLVRKDMIDRSFQVVVSDVTELLYQGGKAYLCVHLDIFGKMLYGWELSRNPDSALVVESFKMACSSIKRLLGKIPAGIIVHQDRGSVYTGIDYVNAALKGKFRLSYSRRGEPGDNAVNESFFSRLKEEWRDVFNEARTFEELEKMVRKAIDYYNTQRYHSSIGLTAPLKFTKEQARYLAMQHLEVVY